MYLYFLKGILTHRRILLTWRTRIWISLSDVLHKASCVQLQTSLKYIKHANVVLDVHLTHWNVMRWDVWRLVYRMIPEHIHQGPHILEVLQISVAILRTRVCRPKRIRNNPWPTKVKVDMFNLTSAKSCHICWYVNQQFWFSTWKTLEHGGFSTYTT